MIFPATVTLKYNLETGAGFKPYIGAGPSYFFIFGEDVDTGPRCPCGNICRADNATGDNQSSIIHGVVRTRKDNCCNLFSLKRRDPCNGAA
ncbi:OmpW family outer membrane protein [Sphingorhabdus wooponensis]|uniref:OmpW family outer membrane protein n=1 Tax=Sphingorhabdus wooponensis TaxID=940136 RepID=UPI001FE2B4F1|nr:OmpW family outer membrane protein [Sphingorhabdus wooponensis]